MARPPDPAQVLKDFRAAVNMQPAELEGWLETPESRSVGFVRRGESESVGHRSGRRIVGLLRTGSGEYEDDDYAHMRKVVGYVRRHLAQRPDNSVTSRWRYSLMNWGHDPLK
jgi:hypothetical protein